MLAPFRAAGARSSSWSRPPRPGKVLRARPAAWLKRSPERQEALCPVFTRCGGCSYQHIDYAGELCYKRQNPARDSGADGRRQVGGRDRDRVGRAVGLPQPHAASGAAERRRIQVGFYAAGSHALVAADECPINSPKLNEAHRALARDGPRGAVPRISARDRIVLPTRSGCWSMRPGRPASSPRSFFALCAERIDGVARDGSSITDPAATRSASGAGRSSRSTVSSRTSSRAAQWETLPATWRSISIAARG